MRRAIIGYLSHALLISALLVIVIGGSNVYNRVTGVDHRLQVLESHIVGECSDELPLERQPNCGTGWTREQMKQLVLDLCGNNPGLSCQSIVMR